MCRTSKDDAEGCGSRRGVDDSAELFWRLYGSGRGWTPLVGYLDLGE